MAAAVLRSVAPKHSKSQTSKRSKGCRRGVRTLRRFIWRRLRFWTAALGSVRSMPIFLSLVIRASRFLPQEIGVGANVLLGPLLRLVPNHERIAKRRQLTSPADMHPGMKTARFLFGHKMQISSSLDSNLRSSSLVFDRYWKDMKDCVPGV